MKKPKSILFAAICMVLVAAIAAGCAFTSGQVTEPERTTPTSTEPIPSTDSTESTQTLPVEEAQALITAEKLIDQYKWYKAVGVCCEFEHISQDLSQFLTVEQKEEYCGYQYRLTCCHTAQEVGAHIDRCFASSVLLRGYPDDLLFTDDQGSLYLIVTPTEYDGYRHIQLEEYSANRIIASACIYDEDGCWCTETFTIEHNVITQIIRNDTVPEHLP